MDYDETIYTLAIGLVCCIGFYFLIDATLNYYEPKNEFCAQKRYQAMEQFETLNNVSYINCFKYEHKITNTSIERYKVNKVFNYSPMVMNK